MAVRRNLLANFAGSAWTGVAAVVFIPVYIRAIGAEGFGLIGFYLMLSAVISVLDGGFGAAAARQLAQVGNGTKCELERLRTLIATLEYCFWFAAVFLGVCLLLSANSLAVYWLNVSAADQKVTTTALQLMAVSLALQWQISFYSGCINGLQRQVGLNALNAGYSTLRAVGAAALLSYVSPTITAFFAWQVFVGVLQVVSMKGYLWRAMPGTGPAPFRLSSVRTVRRFALGVAGINILGLLVTQIDKIILSKVLLLQQFGIYALAATLTSLILRIVMPVFNACYPRITMLVASGDRESLVSFYRSSCDLMAFTIVPVSLLLVVFGEQVIMLWTGDVLIAEKLRWVIAFLAAGTLFNGLMTIPYALQLAHGWTSLALWQNVIAVCLTVPFIWFLTQTFGLPGAATVWLIVNLGYMLLSAPIMYSKLLRTEKWRWYIYAVVIPIGATLAVLIPIRYLWSMAPDFHSSRIALFFVIAAAGLLAQLALFILFRRSRRPMFTLSVSTY